MSVGITVEFTGLTPEEEALLPQMKETRSALLGVINRRIAAEEEAAKRRLEEAKKEKPGYKYTTGGIKQWLGDPWKGIPEGGGLGSLDGKKFSEILDKIFAEGKKQIPTDFGTIDMIENKTMEESLSDVEKMILRDRAEAERNRLEKMRRDAKRYEERITISTPFNPKIFF